MDRNRPRENLAGIKRNSNLNMIYIDDKDVWPKLSVDDLWVYDKLILAKKLGHQAAPAGVPVPNAGWYVVRPITNLRMMSRGAQKIWLTPDDTDLVPDGFFWTEYFEGRHISVDFHHGIGVLAVEGFRNSNRLDRFCRWEKIHNIYQFPAVLGDMYLRQPWINIEYVGSKIIELHMRWNDDFSNHNSNVIYPVWQDDPIPQPENTTWYHSPAGDRLGFWIQE
jgi:hypothetical protein